MRELPTSLEIIGPDPDIHPWTEEEGWECINVAGGSLQEHTETVEKFVNEGYEVYLDGFIQDTEIRVAHLIRKI